MIQDYKLEKILKKRERKGKMEMKKKKKKKKKAGLGYKPHPILLFFH